MNTYQRLFCNLHDDYVFNLKLWRIDLLDQSAFGELARLDADWADMVIIAWNRPESLTDTFRAWVDQWQGITRKTSSVLVSLYTGTNGNEATTALERDFFHPLAERAGLDLIPTFPDRARNVITLPPLATSTLTAARVALSRMFYERSDLDFAVTYNEVPNR